MATKDVQSVESSVSTYINMSNVWVEGRKINEEGYWSLGLLQMDFFYRKKKWYAGQFVRKITSKQELSLNAILFFTALFNGLKEKLLSVLVRDVDELFKKQEILLSQTKEKKIDFEYMEVFVKAMEKRVRGCGQICR